jgi:hypothetical protein
MSADKFTLSPNAAAQMTMVDEDEKALIAAIFGSEFELLGSRTKKLDTGDFGSRIGDNIVFWRAGADGKREIVAIIHASYLDQPVVPAHAAE